ncbi:hypothetical protein ABE237_28770 [Brevibacillus formosus]|uniref:hypothetical protein n=1 Tax=Brevibacillus formosus TaxID=54913 RepID=UPI001F5586DB|nr:hypothetical protein [Brevibacillus formosus]
MGKNEMFGKIIIEQIESQPLGQQGFRQEMKTGEHETRDGGKTVNKQADKQTIEALKVLQN